MADHIEAYDLIVLDAVRAWAVPGYHDKRMFHYRGDGTFIADGEKINYRKEMASKLAPGV